MKYLVNEIKTSASFRQNILNFLFFFVQSLGEFVRIFLKNNGVFRLEKAKNSCFFIMLFISVLR